MLNVVKAVLVFCLVCCVSSAYAVEGVYAGLNIGVGGSPGTNGVGFPYGGNVGYGFGKVAVEYNPQTFGYNTSNSGSTSGVMVMNRGNLINAIVYVNDKAEERGFFKLGYGKMSTAYDETTVSLKTTKWQYDTTTYVVGFGTETGAKAGSFALRTGVDFYLQTPVQSGMPSQTPFFDLYANLIVHF